MKSSQTLVVKNNLNELHKILEFVKDFCGSGRLIGFTPKATLILEELLTNVVSYGYDDDTEHAISISLAADDAGLQIIFEDDGRAFDPLAAPKPNIDGSIEERPIGGLGVYLVVSMSDEINYVREGDTNRLTMRLNNA